MISLADFGEAWWRFFHAPEGVGTLCLFRVLFGMVLVANGLTLLPYAKEFFGPRGLLGAAGWAKAYPSKRLSLFHLLPATDSVALGTVVAFLVADGMLTMGLFTAVSGPVGWLLLVSLHHRNPPIFNSGDSLQRILLLLLCFAPSGAGLSVDVWLNGENPVEAMREREFDPWPVRLMQIQISILYLRSVYWKLRGQPWRKGTAVAYVLQAMSFRRYSAPRLVLIPWVYRSLTYGTMIVETYIPIALWFRETRWSAIVVGWLLHLGFETFLNVHLFGWTMCVGLVLFVPPDVAGQEMRVRRNAEHRLDGLASRREQTTHSNTSEMPVPLAMSASLQKEPFCCVDGLDNVSP